MSDRIQDLGELAEDDAHKLGRTLAFEVQHTGGPLAGGLCYDGPVSIYVEGVGTYTLRIHDDPESTLWDGNTGDWGTFDWDAAQRSGDRQRPSGMDGAARKLDSRSGPVWWQPPAGENANDQLRERVRRFLAEDWSYVGVSLTLSIPGHEDQETALWGIESDPGDYLTEVIDNLASELQPGDVLENVALARQLRAWADIVVDPYAITASEMHDMADSLDPKKVDA